MQNRALDAHHGDRLCLRPSSARTSPSFRDCESQRGEGEHGGGVGEAEDAAAAVAFLTSQPEVKKDGTVLAGYSFGSVAAMTAAPKIKGLGALVLVALPLKMADPGALNDFAGPIMMAAGDGDTYCLVPQLEALHKELGERAQLRIVAGADHFFGGLEVELADAIESMLGAI